MGWKRPQIAQHLDRGYIARIIGYPRDDTGKLLREEPEEQRNPWFVMRDVLRKQGWPEWRIIDHLRKQHARHQVEAQEQWEAQFGDSGPDSTTDAYWPEPGGPAPPEVHPGDRAAGEAGTADGGPG